MLKASASILQVFNHYRQPGGESVSVERIGKMLHQRHEVHMCEFNSHEWTGHGAPPIYQQALHLFYHAEGRKRFEQAVADCGADLAVLHNIYPVGSPAIYKAALDLKLPLIQFLHNYRPFSVGGTLFSKQHGIFTEPLRGSYMREVREGAWMESRSRSLMMALLLKMLHRSGWLESVRVWVSISDFMRDKLIEAGAVRPERIVTLRHAWDALPQAPERQDAGYYLFMGRLIHEKGLLPLLAAWDILRERLGRDTPSLHVAGEGPLAALLTERARSNPYICALGHIGGGTKSEQLTRCRAVIVPSIWWEPLGLVVYEAYDHAKPVLAARAGGLAETVLPGQTGLVHEPGSVDEIVRDVLDMQAMSSTERASMGAKGRHWLRQETEPGRWVMKFEQIAELAMLGQI